MPNDQTRHSSSLGSPGHEPPQPLQVFIIAVNGESLATSLSVDVMDVVLTVMSFGPAFRISLLSYSLYNVSPTHVYDAHRVWGGTCQHCQLYFK